jgi:hypothetical protein
MIIYVHLYKSDIVKLIPDQNLCIGTRVELKNIDQLKDMIFKSIGIINMFEDIDGLHIELKQLISYMFKIVDVFKSGNYDDEEFKQIKILCE